MEQNRFSDKNVNFEKDGVTVSEMEMVERFLHSVDRGSDKAPHVILELQFNPVYHPAPLQKLKRIRAHLQSEFGCHVLLSPIDNQELAFCCEVKAHPQLDTVTNDDLLRAEQVAMAIIHTHMTLI